MATNDSINVHISADTSGFSGAISRVQSSLGRLQSACSSAMSGMSRSIVGAHNALSGFANGIHSQISGAASSISALSAKLFPVVEVAKTAVGAISAIAGPVIDLGMSAVKASADMEVLKKGLEFNFAKQLGDDTEAAKEKVDLLLNSMAAIGEHSAFDANQLIPMARSWVNIGDSAETAIAKMRTITDAASAYGLSAEAMERVNLALTQMQMKGKMQAEEMMQLTEAGVPAWTLLSEAMGLPVAQLQDMASKGQLTQEAMAQLFTAMQEQTGGMSDNLNTTLSGMFANIQEAAESSLSGIGDLIVQGLDLKGVLADVGDFTDSFKEHLGYIQEHAKEVGVGQAITDELNSMGLYGVADFVESVISMFDNFVKTFETFVLPAIDRLGIAFDENGEAAGKALTGIEVLVEVLIVCLGGIIDIIALIIQWAGALYDFWSSVIGGIADAISALCGFMAEHFGGAFADIAAGWEQIRAKLAHPLDLLINIVWHDTKTGETTAGSRKSISDVLGDAPKFDSSMFGGSSILPSAPSGGGGFGGGGRSGTGGRSGGGSGRGSGRVKEEPWEGRQDYIAEVSKQADEAAEIIVKSFDKAASEAEKALKPIFDGFKTDDLGNTLKEAFAKGTTELTKAQEVIKKIGKESGNKDLDIYGKTLREAEDKMQKIGEYVREYQKYLDDANRTAAEYGEKGEKTLQFEQQRLSLLKQIGDLQEKIVKGKAAEGDEGKLEALQQQLASKTADYNMKKANALKDAQEASQNLIAVTQATENAREQIITDTQNKLHARETALRAAEDQQKKASTATELADYVAMMEAKDAYTGQSYASILAQEEALNAQRQVWHEQLMMNAMEWADFMSMTFANLNQQLIDGLSSGLAECIVQGKTLGEVLQNLAANLLQTLINNVMKKWLTSLIGIGAQGKINAAQEAANAAKTVAIERTKTPVLTENAIAASIAARPIIPAAATASEVIGAVGMGKAAAFATGGLVSGAGTSTSDSIPAMLSNGEFVMRAEAVNRIGTSTLYALNEGKTFHYSDGGQVGMGSAGTAAVSSPSITLNVSAMDASGFEGFLLNGGLDTIRQALYDNNRNFGAAAGVF